MYIYIYIYHVMFNFIYIYIQTYGLHIYIYIYSMILKHGNEIVLVRSDVLIPSGHVFHATYP